LPGPPKNCMFVSLSWRSAGLQLPPHAVATTRLCCSLREDEPVQFRLLERIRADRALLQLPDVALALPRGQLRELDEAIEADHADEPSPPVTLATRMTREREFRTRTVGDPNRVERASPRIRTHHRDRTFHLVEVIRTALC